MLLSESRQNETWRRVSHSSSPDASDHHTVLAPQSRWNWAGSCGALPGTKASPVTEWTDEDDHNFHDFLFELKKKKKASPGPLFLVWKKKKKGFSLLGFPWVPKSRLKQLMIRTIESQDS